MKKKLSQTLILGALAGAAVALLEPKKKSGVAGLGDVDTSSPEYASWYYNVYLPSMQRRQSGWNYQPYQFNPYQYQQANNPYSYLMPQYQQGLPYSTQAQDQCLVSGGKWEDTGHGFACSTGVVPQTYSPYVSNPYAGNPYNPYVNPYAQYGGGPQACSVQGGFWDSFTGQCTR